MSVERNLLLSRDGLGSMEEALSWIVKTYDAEFADATRVEINLQKILHCDGDAHDEWHPVWIASVGGQTNSKEEEDE